jgi:hypothetical protein
MILNVSPARSICGLATVELAWITMFGKWWNKIKGSI